MKHIKNAKVTAKIQIREGAQIRVLGGTGINNWYRYRYQVPVSPVSGQCQWGCPLRTMYLNK